MNPTTVANIINLTLTGINAGLSTIAEIKSASGLTDDQILALAEQTTGANSTAYLALKAHLASLSSPTAP